MPGVMMTLMQILMAVLHMSNQSKPATLESVAVQVNAKYWEAHALLHACWCVTKDNHDNDLVEFKELLNMASSKVLDMVSLIQPYLPTKEGAHHV